MTTTTAHIESAMLGAVVHVWKRPGLDGSALTEVMACGLTRQEVQSRSPNSRVVTHQGYAGMTGITMEEPWCPACVDEMAARGFSRPLR